VVTFCGAARDGVLYTIWWRYGRPGRRLIQPTVDEAELPATTTASLLPLYTIVFVLAFFRPFAGVILTPLLATFHLPSATFSPSADSLSACGRRERGRSCVHCRSRPG
jgi:hypothetical protein